MIISALGWKFCHVIDCAFDFDRVLYYRQGWNFNPVNRAEFNPGVENAPCNRPLRFAPESEIGPQFSPSPPRDGRRFVVKVQSSAPWINIKPHTLYDRSLELYEEIQSKVIAKLVQEFGIQCEKQYAEKKVFLHCLFGKNGQIRLFINEFAAFLKW
jgi:hypothetical protein